MAVITSRPHLTAQESLARITAMDDTDRQQVVQHFLDIVERGAYDLVLAMSEAVLIVDPGEPTPEDLDTISEWLRYPAHVMVGYPDGWPADA